MAKVALKNSLTSEPGTHFEDPAEEDVAVSGVGWIPRNGVNGRSRIKSGGDVEEQRADNCKVHNIKSVSTLFNIKSPVFYLFSFVYPTWLENGIKTIKCKEYLLHTLITSYI